MQAAITDTTGIYFFSAVAPGDYYVQVIKPVGCAFGLVHNDIGGDDTKDSDFSGFNGPNTSATFTLALGGSNSTIDAGFFNNCD